MTMMTAKRKRLRLTLHIMENIEEKDTTHSQNENTTTILKATVVRNEPYEPRINNIVHSTDTGTVDRRHPGTRAAQHESLA